MNDFEWMDDVPDGDFTGDQMGDFFEFAQVGDEIYMHGTIGRNAFSIVKHDTFGKIVAKTDIKIQIQVPNHKGGGEMRYSIPKIYEKVPELWVQEQGFIGEYELIEEKDGPTYYDYQPNVVKKVIFRNIVTILKTSRFMEDGHYDNFKIHLIDRNMAEKR